MGKLVKQGKYTVRRYKIIIQRKIVMGDLTKNNTDMIKKYKKKYEVSRAYTELSNVSEKP